MRQNSILSGASVLMVTVFATKFLGLIRGRLLLHYFDANTAGIFLAGFNLPDLMFQLLIFGALSAAFIPVFTEHLNKNGEKDAFSFASNILNLALLVFCGLSVLAFVFVDPLNSLLVPGLHGQQKMVANQLSQLILLSELFLIMGSLFIAMAQSYQRFIISSLAPIFYNLGIIFGIVVLAPFFGIVGPAVGVIIGAILHVLVQIPLMRSLGFKYKLSFDFYNKGVREIFQLMSIRNIGLAFEQLNDRVGFALASLITTSSITHLTFAQQLQAVPIGLFGMTIAQAAFPVLSRERSKGNMESYKFTLLNSMHQILFLTLPATAILVVLRIPVVRLAFGAAKFSWEDTVLTGRTLAFLAVGLAAQAVIMLLIRGFYALKDTKTPVIVSIVSVSVNVILSVVLVTVLHWPVWSLGISYSIASNLSLILLIYLINRKVDGFHSEAFILPALKMLLAALVSAFALYIPIKALDQLVIDTTRTLNLIFLTGIASVFGLSIYLLLVWLMDIKEVYIFAQFIKKVYKMRIKVDSKEVIKETGSI